MNLHDFRHFWATMLKEDYGVNDEEIKMLLGHKRTGNGMNRVSNHSTDSIFRPNTLRKIGEVDNQAAKPLTPIRCGACEEKLESHWTYCPVCGTAYGP